MELHGLKTGFRYEGVLKIMGPFGYVVLRHLIFQGYQSGTLILGGTHERLGDPCSLRLQLGLQRSVVTTADHDLPVSMGFGV